MRVTVRDLMTLDPVTVDANATINDTINTVLDEYRANEVAEVDAALLTDDLPPQAYTDPGFLHFLKLQSADHTSD